MALDELKSIVTIKAKEKILKARAGIEPIPKIQYMVFGNGVVGNPTAEITQLKNELLKKEIASVTEINPLCYEYMCVLEESDLIGITITEIGLSDAAGDLVAYKKLLGQGKEDEMKMRFKIQDKY